LKQEVDEEQRAQQTSFADEIASEVAKLTAELDRIHVQLSDPVSEQTNGETAEEHTNEEQREDDQQDHLNIPEAVMQRTMLCPICRDCDTDTLLPEILMGIHRVMVHTDVGEKFVK
jgi:hypothetical protein